MHFTSALLVIWAAAIGTRAESCSGGGASSNRTWAALHTCWGGYNAGNRGTDWNGEFCGGAQWYKGGVVWDNPTNCAEGCNDCINKAIDQAWNNVECRQRVVGARCWTGYQLHV